jgi:hypothetical protein
MSRAARIALIGRNDIAHEILDPCRNRFRPARYRLSLSHVPPASAAPAVNFDVAAYSTTEFALGQRSVGAGTGQGIRWVKRTAFPLSIALRAWCNRQATGGGRKYAQA